MFRIPKMEIQERILSKVHSLKEIGNSVLSETNVDDIIDGIISNKYKYHETLDFEESITISKNLSGKQLFELANKIWCLQKAVNLKATPEQEQDGLLCSNIASQSNINGRRPNSTNQCHANLEL
jgi:hypothetical protein